jgi:hypothetical protein
MSKSLHPFTPCEGVAGDRLLDLANTSITLNTMAEVAKLLRKRIDFVLR